jgi:hypothetical protein
MLLQSEQFSPSGRYVVIGRMVQTTPNAHSGEPFYWAEDEGWTTYETCDIYNHKLLQQECFPSPWEETCCILSFEEIKRRWRFGPDGRIRRREMTNHPVTPLCEDDRDREKDEEEEYDRSIR